jgi:DNA polymerase-3 subunit alpha
VLTYQTAWLKAHYPAAFMAAVLSSDMDKTDKVVTFIDECRAIGLNVLPPDVNASMYRFTVADPKTIRYGLGAVKGVGEGAVQAVIEERTRNGPFTGIADFCRRIDLQRVNKRVLEGLIRAGCLDRIGPNRATLMAELPAAMQLGEQNTRARELGQNDLFGLGAPPPPQASAVATVHVLPEWPESVRLAGERQTLGLYLTGHPIAEYEADLKSFVSGRIADVASGRPAGAGEGKWMPPKNVTIAGLVLEVRRRGNRTSLVLDDRSGRIEVSLFDEVFQNHRDIVMQDAILVVEGGLRWDDFIEGWRVSAKRLIHVDQIREQQARRLLLRWPEGADPATFVRQLETLLRPARGGKCVVAVFYRSPQAKAQAMLTLSADWTIRPGRALLDELEKHFGRDGWRLVYHPRDEADLLAKWGATGTVSDLPLKMTG